MHCYNLTWNPCISYCLRVPFIFIVNFKKGSQDPQFGCENIIQFRQSNTHKRKFGYLRTKLSLSYIFEKFLSNMSENECRECARLYLLFFVQRNSCFNKADNKEHKQDEDKDRQRLGMLSQPGVTCRLKGYGPPNIRDGTAAFSHVRIGISWISHA